MLSDAFPMARLATGDLGRARHFYEEVLGFVGDLDGDAVLYKAGTGQFSVYVSAFAGTNQATGLVLVVAPTDFDAEIADLRARGVSFQTYDLDGATWAGDVATVRGTRAVWLRDPDGNIIAVAQGARRTRRRCDGDRIPHSQPRSGP